MPTGQVVPTPAPVAELLEKLRDMPLPPEPPAQRDIRELPGGVGQHDRRRGRRARRRLRGRFKNVGFSEGFDDYSTARVRLELDDDGEPIVEVHTAAAEVGQGVVTVQAQIARTELGVERVVVRNADTQIGSAGSSSASRQTYVTGGAVKAACEAVRERWEAHGELQPGDVIEETRRVAPQADVQARLRTARATRTSSSRSPPTAPSSTSTWSSGSCASSSWPRPRRSARR